MSNKKVTCNYSLDLNVNKSAPNLSQSESAFNSRFHTGKIAYGGSRNKKLINKKKSRKLSKKTKGCGCQSGGGYYLAVGQKRVGGLPEVVSVFDPIPPKYSPKGAGQYPKPSFLTNQKGGAYNFIVNPETGRRVKLNGKIGKRVLKNYLIAQNGGDLSIFDPNMQNREFGCKQPVWKPNCV